MRKLTMPLLALVLLSIACETESIGPELNSGPVFRYNTQQNFPVVRSAVIDFENYNPGKIVSEIELSEPFQNAAVIGITSKFPDTNAAMVFDSSNPTGGDFDLGTPNEIYGGPGIGDGGESNDVALGNVLILSEDLDSEDPDDIFEVGASFVFDFSNNGSVTLNAFDILDIEDFNTPTMVILYDSNNAVLLSKEIPPGGDNSKMNVDLENTPGVAFMEIVMNNSGAIDNIAFEMTEEEACVACDSDINSLIFRYLGETDNANIRVESEDGELIFENTLQIGETFEVRRENGEALGEGINIFLNDQLVTGIPTDCSEAVGPGFFIEFIEIISGTTVSGGQLCPVEIV